MKLFVSLFGMLQWQRFWHILNQRKVSQPHFFVIVVLTCTFVCVTSPWGMCGMWYGQSKHSGQQIW